MSGFDINTVTVSGNLTREPELRNLFARDSYGIWQFASVADLRAGDRVRLVPSHTDTTVVLCPLNRTLAPSAPGVNRSTSPIW